MFATMDGDFLCTQALTDDLDETYVEDEDSKREVATLKVLPNKKLGIPVIEFPVYIGENIVGRHTNCDISIPWSVVLSKKHAVIEAESESCFISDCGSSNKTRIGKTKLKPNVKYGLRDGDQVIFGNVQCVFSQKSEETHTKKTSQGEQNHIKGCASTTEASSDTPSSNKTRILAADTPDHMMTISASIHRTLNESTSTIPESQPVSVNTPISVKNLKNENIPEFPSPLPFDDENIVANKKTTQQQSPSTIVTPGGRPDLDISHVPESDNDSHMNSDTDLEDNAENPRFLPETSVEDAYEADTIELISGKSSQVSEVEDQKKPLEINQVLESDTDYEDEEVSMLKNLGAEATQRYALLPKEVSTPQPTKNKDPTCMKQESSLSDSDDAAILSIDLDSIESGSANEAGTSGVKINGRDVDEVKESGINEEVNVDSDSLEFHDTFDELCTQAFTRNNIPASSNNNMEDTMGMLETQAFGGCASPEESEDTQDSMYYDMPTQAFPGCVESPFAQVKNKFEKVIPTENDMPQIGDSIIKEEASSIAEEAPSNKTMDFKNDSRNCEIAGASSSRNEDSNRDAVHKEESLIYQAAVNTGESSTSHQCQGSTSRIIKIDGKENSGFSIIGSCQNLRDSELYDSGTDTEMLIAAAEKDKSSMESEDSTPTPALVRSREASFDIEAHLHIISNQSTPELKDEDVTQDKQNADDSTKIDTSPRCQKTDNVIEDSGDQDDRNLSKQNINLPGNQENGNSHDPDVEIYSDQENRHLEDQDNEDGGVQDSKGENDSIYDEATQIYSANSTQNENSATNEQKQNSPSLIEKESSKIDSESEARTRLAEDGSKSLNESVKSKNLEMDENKNIIKNHTSLGKVIPSNSKSTSHSSDSTHLSGQTVNQNTDSAEATHVYDLEQDSADSHKDLDSFSVEENKLNIPHPKSAATSKIVSEKICLSKNDKKFHNDDLVPGSGKTSSVHEVGTQLLGIEQTLNNQDKASMIGKDLPESSKTSSVYEAETQLLGIEQTSNNQDEDSKKNERILESSNSADVYQEETQPDVGVEPILNNHDEDSKKNERILESSNLVDVYQEETQHNAGLVQIPSNQTGDSKKNELILGSSNVSDVYQEETQSYDVVNKSSKLGKNKNLLPESYSSSIAIINEEPSSPSFQTPKEAISEDMDVTQAYVEVDWSRECTSKKMLKEDSTLNDPDATQSYVLKKYEKVLESRGTFNTAVSSLEDEDSTQQYVKVSTSNFKKSIDLVRDSPSSTPICDLDATQAYVTILPSNSIESCKDVQSVGESSRDVEHLETKDKTKKLHPKDLKKKDLITNEAFTSEPVRKSRRTARKDYMNLSKGICAKTEEENSILKVQTKSNAKPKQRKSQQTSKSKEEIVVTNEEVEKTSEPSVTRKRNGRKVVKNASQTGNTKPESRQALCSLQSDSVEEKQSENVSVNLNTHSETEQFTSNITRKSCSIFDVNNKESSEKVTEIINLKTEIKETNVKKKRGRQKRNVKDEDKDDQSTSSTRSKRSSGNLRNSSPCSSTSTETKSSSNSRATRSRKISGLKQEPAHIDISDAVSISSESSSLSGTSSKKTIGRRKRRNTSISSTASSNVSNKEHRTPAKKVKYEEISSDVQHAAAMALRPKKSKPKVMFTGVLDTTAEAIVVNLGGTLVSDIEQCTHLVTEKMRRTIKFLCAVTKGLYIVTLDWLHMSAKHNKFLPEEDFELNENLQSPNGETLQGKYNFHLSETLKKASESAFPLFHGYSVFVTKKVAPPPDQMHQILKCAGADILHKMPSFDKAEGTRKTVIIATPSDKKICAYAIKAGCRVVTNEFVLTGILRHSLDFEENSLFDSCSNESNENTALEENMQAASNSQERTLLTSGSNTTSKRSSRKTRKK